MDSTPWAALNGADISKVPDCEESERYFGQTVQAMLDPDRAGYTKDGQRIGWTIFTHNGDAVALSKDLNARALYSLRPLVVDGILMPSGALFAAQATDIGRRTRGTRAVEETNVIDGVRLQRLSAFAVSPSDRMWDFPEVVASTPVDSPARRVSIDEIQIIAQLTIPKTAVIR